MSRHVHSDVRQAAAAVALLQGRSVIQYCHSLAALWGWCAVL